MAFSLPIAEQTGYLLAGGLTVVAAVIVTFVMVVTSKSDKDGPEGP